MELFCLILLDVILVSSVNYPEIKLDNPKVAVEIIIEY
jgi:hypothetical protein